MSYLYTNETSIREKKQKNLVNIIDPVVVYDDTLIYYPYIVSREEAMRIDLICFNIYNNFLYIDELLTINNILNPWSIKEGQTIYFLDDDAINLIRLSAKANEQEVIENIINPNKDTKKDPNRESGKGLIPTIKPGGLKNVNVDFNNKKIKIIDRFK